RFEQRRKLMQGWAQYLISGSPRGGDKRHMWTADMDFSVEDEAQADAVLQALREESHRAAEGLVEIAKIPASERQGFCEAVAGLVGQIKLEFWGRADTQVQLERLAPGTAQVFDEMESAVNALLVAERKLSDFARRYLTNHIVIAYDELLESFSNVEPTI